MTKWPDRTRTAELLASIAEAAVARSDAEHPDDVANVMINAIENGALMVETLTRRGVQLP